MKVCILCEEYEVKSRQGYRTHLGVTHKEHNNDIWEIDREYMFNLSWKSMSKGDRRRFLFEEANWACTECGYDKCRSDGKSILEIDHIDGDPNNNAKKNLKVLCPNCHALTPTYRNWGREGHKKSSPRFRKGNKGFDDEQRKQRTLHAKLKEEFEKEFVSKVLALHESKEIDFSKFGWVQRLADLNNEKPQVTGKRVRRLMPDFYVEHCYVRGYGKYKNARVAE